MVLLIVHLHRCKFLLHTIHVSRTCFPYNEDILREKQVFYHFWKLLNSYRKFHNYSDTPKHCCNHSKIWTMWLYHRVISSNDADGMANSVDRDQTAPLGAVWSGSALFAQAYLSENLGSLRYDCFWQQAKVSISDIRLPLLPAPYCKAVQENVGFQLLLLAKDYILSFSCSDSGGSADFRVQKPVALIKEHPLIYTAGFFCFAENNL